MSDQPLVAVFTPVYNGEGLLDAAMKSVQAQTYPNLVHVIVDNASSDATPEIISKYADGPVPIVVQRNEETIPIRDNWNAAVALVPQEATYIRLLCADDTITPDSIEEMVALAETDPEIGIVGCLHECIGQVWDFRWPKDRNIYDGLEAIRMILLGEGEFMAVQTLMRKSIADSRQPFIQHPYGGFDMDAMLDLLTRSKFGFVHKALGMTGVHANSVTNTVYTVAARSWTSDCLHYLTAYGPQALGDEYREHLLRFRRYYVRRILRWRQEGADEEMLNKHYETLERAGWKFGPALIADAVADWGLQKVGLRKNWTGYPGWQ